jgi:hypothetical protein
MNAVPLWLAYCEYGHAVAVGVPVALNVESLRISGPDQPLLANNSTLVSVNVPLNQAGLDDVAVFQELLACILTSL